MIASEVSASGTNRMMIGKPRVMNAVVLKPNKAMQAIMKPMKRAPQSPTNILAGWKLYGRNPAIAPTRIRAMEAKSIRLMK